MTTDREANRLRDKCRKQAIQILALCASTPRLQMHEAREHTDGTASALAFARFAFASTPLCIADCDDAIPFAEAEAMIRNGEVVPTW